MAAAWAIKKHKASNPTIFFGKKKSRNEKTERERQVFVISVTDYSVVLEPWQLLSSYYTSRIECRQQ